MEPLPVITDLAAAGSTSEPQANRRAAGAAPRGQPGNRRAAERAALTLPLTVERALRARRSEIRARWLELLFVEPVNTPLANPRALIFLLDETLDSIFALLRRGDVQATPPAPDCPCGRNPYLSYFRAGRQALFEALILLQAATPDLDPAERDGAVVALDAALRRIAADAIEGFGSLCRHRAAGFTACDHPEYDRIDGLALPDDEADDSVE